MCTHSGRSNDGSDGDGGGGKASVRERKRNGKRYPRASEKERKLEIGMTTTTVASQPVGRPARVRERGEEGNDSARLPTGFDTFVENYATVTAATVVSPAFFESLRNRSIALPSREFSSIKGVPSRLTDARDVVRSREHAPMMRAR